MFLTKKFVFFASKKRRAVCFKRRTAQRNTNFLFICFNGSFLKNRSKKGLFPSREELLVSKEEPLKWFVSEQKNTSEKKNHTTRTAQKNTKLLFFCFKSGLFPKKNGSFLKNRSRRRTACFKKRTAQKKTNFCLFVSGKRSMVRF